MFTKTELLELQKALNHAIYHEHCYMESHYTGFAVGKDGYKKPKIVPATFRNIVARSRRRIKKWKLLLSKIKRNT